MQGQAHLGTKRRGMKSHDTRHDEAPQHAQSWLIKIFVEKQIEAPAEIATGARHSSGWYKHIRSTQGCSSIASWSQGMFLTRHIS